MPATDNCTEQAAGRFRIWAKAIHRIESWPG